MNVVVLALANQRYAIPVAHVREIVRAAALAELPGAPEVVEGVANLRGELIPVLDMRRRFGHPERAMALSDLLLIVDRGARHVALHVDRVLGVEDVADERVVQPGELVPRSAFIAGLAALSDGTLLIHDPSAFLAESESEALDAALAVEASS